ncbi:MAG TPA: SCO family protein [Candidatus Acidoferrum sp.]|nr:SCO family protein [Candidatus Acidoferrum sp.]
MTPPVLVRGSEISLREICSCEERGLRFARIRLAILILGVAFFAAACGNSSKQPVQRYHMEGTVVAIDRQNQQLEVDHKEIPGFMGAMTMSYPVKTPFVFDQVSAGDQITADVIVSGGQDWLENIKVVKKADPNAPAPAAPPEVREPQPGDAVPDFVLVNQDGKQIHLADFRGESVLLTFIYTRCPLADYCPAMSTRFSVIEEALQNNKQALGKTHLLSISFDPKHDTPKVLRDYGLGFLAGAREKDFRHWEFAVAPERNLKDVAAFFGLVYMPDEDQFTHSMSTLIISPNGKIYKFYGGKDWQTSDVMKDLLSSTGS